MLSSMVDICLAREIRKIKGTLTLRVLQYCIMKLLSVRAVLNADMLVLQVQAVPTVLGMKDGKIIDRFVGLKDEADLEIFVQKLID